MHINLTLSSDKFNLRPPDLVEFVMIPIRKPAANLYQEILFLLKMHSERNPCSLLQGASIKFFTQISYGLTAHVISLLKITIKKLPQHIDVYLVPVYNTPMKTTIETIIAEVLSLSPQARAFVAEKLIESLDSELEVTLSSAWREEVRKRCRAIDEGTVELRDAEDVFSRGYSALG